MKRHAHLVFALLLAAAGCGSSDKTDAQFQAQIVAQMSDFLVGKAQALNQAARDLRDAAPTPTDRGWDATLDAQAIAAMKSDWNQMRSAWESAEGVIGALFGDIDGALDARYEEYLAALPAGDADLFDGQGVTGMHAIERILYAPDTSDAVKLQESMLAGYVAAAWPATPEQADEIKTGLLTELVDDSQLLVTRLTPGVIDLSSTFAGMTRLMDEQKEKVDLVASHLDESRYAQRTLADLRDNLAGTEATYALFAPWLLSKVNGVSRDNEVRVAFGRLDQTYQSSGDKIPDPPPSWNSSQPTMADQMTSFGQLYLAVVREVDPTYTGSAVDAMNHVASMLDIPPFMGAP
jgi:iron uptake system component EfeO